MKIKNLQVDGFGVWTELDLQALSQRVTMVFGANETGKTTLMQFIRSMLYGFSPERRGRVPAARYMAGVPGGDWTSTRPRCADASCGISTSLGTAGRGRGTAGPVGRWARTSPCAA